MMLEASNLGQIIGRALYGETAPSLSSTPQAESAPAESRPRTIRRDKGRKLIVELLARAKRPLTRREIAEALGMNADIVSASLSQLPELEKLVEQRPYTWRVRG